MITLDKSQKLPYKTYFYFPEILADCMSQLFYQSNENQVKLAPAIELNYLVPEDKRKTTLQYYKTDSTYIDNNPCVCISKYPEHYLFKTLEKHINDSERYNKNRQFSKKLTEIRKQGGENHGDTR